MCVDILGTKFSILVYCFLEVFCGLFMVFNISHHIICIRDHLISSFPIFDGLFFWLLLLGLLIHCWVRVETTKPFPSTWSNNIGYGLLYIVVNLFRKIFEGFYFIINGWWILSNHFMHQLIWPNDFYLSFFNVKC